MKEPLLFLFFLFSVFLASGQQYKKGYILTRENDTVKGEILYRSTMKNYKSCIYRDGSGEREYSVDEILGYGYYDDKYYTSEIEEGSFVEVLVKGEMSLYKAGDGFYVQKDTMLYALDSKQKVQSLDGKIARVEKSRWRGILNYLTGDCLKNSNNTLSRLGLSEISLTRFIVDYNACRRSDYTEYKSNKEWLKFDVGLAVGLLKNDLTTSVTSGPFTPAYLDDKYEALDPSIGFVFVVSSPRISEKLAFHTEIHYFQSSYSSLVQIDGPPTEIHDTFIEFTTVSIPFSFQYAISTKAFSPFAQAGFSIDYHPTASTRVLSEQVSGNVVTTSPEAEAFSIEKTQFGYWGGIGVRNSFEKFTGSISLRYYALSPLNQRTQLEVTNNRIALNLILMTR